MPGPLSVKKRGVQQSVDRYEVDVDFSRCCTISVTCTQCGAQKKARAQIAASSTGGDPGRMTNWRVGARFLLVHDTESDSRQGTENAGALPGAYGDGQQFMRIAIPLSNGVLAQHFGHCERFVLMEVDPSGKSISTTTEVEAPEHQPGLLPRWLKERGVTLVIAGNMGSRARSLFEESSIQILTGVQSGSAQTIADMYLAGTLSTGVNTCSH